MAEDDTTLECFNRWKVDDLRKYIRDRGQNVGAKRKAELVDYRGSHNVMTSSCNDVILVGTRTVYL